MERKNRSNAIHLLSRIFDRRTSTETIIPYYPQKIACAENHVISQPFERTSPEAQGISSAHIARFLSDLGSESSLDMHNIMILRNGCVISEGWFGARRSDLWHISYSMTKSVTALAIGMLTDEKKLGLDDRLIDIFNTRNGILRLMKASFTVRHLMTMSTGVTFNETGSVTESDWQAAYLESVSVFETGSRFSYNSMNTYMLACVVKEITGMDVDDYLMSRLWEPLGITQHHWEKSPTGVSKGGWGLYLYPEDAAKIGQLVLNGGVWNGRQLVSREFLDEATSFKISTPETCGDFNYGYQIWVGRSQNSFLFNGMFGQNVVGFKDTGIIVVSNAGNDELFQQSAFFTLLKKYFGPEYMPADTLAENPAELKKLRELEGSLYLSRKKATFTFTQKLKLKKQTASLNGRRWSFSAEAAASVGLLPLYSQALQNNYTKGLRSISFTAEKYSLVIDFEEADETHHIAVGFTQPEYSTIVCHSEPYIVSCFGRFTTDENDRQVLILDMAFCETASDRTIKIYFRPDGRIDMSFTERPGKQYLYYGIENFLEAAAKKRIIEQLTSKTDPGYLHYKTEQVLEPTITGTVAS